MSREEAGGRGRAPACPICGQPGGGRFRPFCSRRCADVDLGRWLTGSYAIPGEAADEGGDGGPRRRAEDDGEG